VTNLYKTHRNKNSIQKQQWHTTSPNEKKQ
jgi:hypothetical protein